MATLNQFIQDTFDSARISNDSIGTADNIVTLLADSEEYCFPVFKGKTSKEILERCSICWIVGYNQSEVSLTLYSSKDGEILEHTLNLTKK